MLVINNRALRCEQPRLELCHLLLTKEDKIAGWLLDNMFPSKIEDVLVAYRGSSRDCEELASAITNVALFN
ncbi:unnamed protein product [Prunus armeniaca]